MTDDSRPQLDWLVRTLIGWSSGSGPLHRQLSDAIRYLIDLGELPQGARLPSERSLANALAVSRTTVISAYNSLRDQDQLESRQGSGTRVRRTESANSQTDGTYLNDSLLRGYFNPVPTTIDFSTAAMAGLQISADVAASLDASEVLALTVDHSYYARGLPQLRTQLADHFTVAGVPTTSDQILITSGAQQALEVIASALLIPGDEVIVEDPTYRGAIQAFQALDAQMLTVPSGLSGIDIEVLSRRLAESRPRLIYVLPTVQNPTGSFLPNVERKALIDLAQRHGVMVIDDASPADLLYNGEAPPYLAAHAPDGQIITIGSCSKLFWTGLRVGWIRAPASVITRLSRVKRGVSDLGTSVISQLIATKLLPHSENARKQRQVQLQGGLSAVTELLEELLPTWRWEVPAGGAALWVKIPHASSSSFSQLALQHGVSIMPGPMFSPEGNFEDIVRIPFGVPLPALRTGMHRLAIAWDEHLRRGVDSGPGNRPIA